MLARARFLYMRFVMNFLLELSFSNLENMFYSFFSVLKAVFSDFNFTDAIDIALLTVLLFFAYKFIRGRKAGALLIGILICFILTFLASIFDLHATHFIFSEIFKIGIIAILIIFQPEIRDALEKIGSGSLGSILNFSDHKRRRMLYQNTINNVCSAVMDLSASKTGALIVIARTTKLDDIIESGITINADVNSSLLRNLFYNKAPLHDGAVIIDEARIAAASCLLPLTRRLDIDSDLGTRHRAAIGMSETSDAVIIIVSEETGTVSVAYDCTLERNFNYESLKRFLNEKLIGVRGTEE